MSKIKILVDSGSDISVDLMEKYDIGVIPMFALFGDDVFMAEPGKETEFYRRLSENNGEVTTSQTPPQILEDILKKQAEENETVLYFTVSGAASGQYNAARVVSRNLENVKVIDTQSFSIYITDAAVYASELAKAGESADRIEQLCKERIGEWQSFIVVDSLMQLQRGGRLKKSSAVIGTMLDIKPVLAISDGLITLKDKMRGGKKLFPRLIDKIYNEYTNPEFLIAESDSEKYKIVESELKARGAKILMHNKIGALIGAHIGEGAMALIVRSTG